MRVSFIHLPIFIDTCKQIICNCITNFIKHNYILFEFLLDLISYKSKHMTLRREKH